MENTLVQCSVFSILVLVYIAVQYIPMHFLMYVYLFLDSPAVVFAQESEVTGETQVFVKAGVTMGFSAAFITTNV